MRFYLDKTEERVQTCAQLVSNARAIGALTGAGISTSAGIPYFRGPQGLYVTRKYDPEKVFDIQYFLKDLKPFFDFARDFIGLEEKIQPTVAHRLLAQLESRGKLAGLVTQNIDSLHQKACSKKVYEMHGSFWKNFCLGCGKGYSYQQMKGKLFEEDVPRCSCGGVIKPDVVFFGENVKYWHEASVLAGQVELFFVIGTSCVVQPAAMIPEMTGADIVVINMDPVELRSSNVVLTVQEDIDGFLEKVAQVLNGK